MLRRLGIVEVESDSMRARHRSPGIEHLSKKGRELDPLQVETLLAGEAQELSDQAFQPSHLEEEELNRLHHGAERMVRIATRTLQDQLCLHRQTRKRVADVMGDLRGDRSDVGEPSALLSELLQLEDLCLGASSLGDVDAHPGEEALPGGIG